MAMGQDERSKTAQGEAPVELIDLDAFISALAEVGVMEPAEVRACLDRLPPAERPTDTAGVARELVRTGHLTRYQATAAARGQARGLSIGDYLILDKIGAGGMGTVFKARHRRTLRTVAVKVLFPTVTRNSKAVPRLRREAQAAAQLNHPNLVSALDLDEIGGMHVFVMDYVEGRDLSRMVKASGPLSIDLALDCVIQAARGLQAAHERGIIHRDVKPANLVLDANGTLKVLDLGLAYVDQHDQTAGEADEYADGLTNPGTVLGTVDYMAPEQAMNSSSVDARTDIYSLGCTLYYLLIGRPPYRGGGALERLLRHREAPIPSMRAERPEIPPVLDEILARMLAKDPASRFASMSELSAAIETCRKNLDADTIETPAPAMVKERKPKKALQTFTLESPSSTVESGRESTFLDLSLDKQDSLLPANAADVIVPSGRRKPATVVGASVAAIVATVLVVGYVVYSSRPRTDSVPIPSTAQSDAETPELPEPRDVPLHNVRPAPRARANPPQADINVAAAAARDTSPIPIEANSANAETKKPKPPDEGTRPPLVKVQEPTLPAPESFGEARLFAGHSRGSVTSVALATNGQRAVSGGEDHSVRIWDITTGELAATLSGHEAPVLTVALSADGHRALSGSADGVLVVWDVESGEELRRLVGHTGAVRAVAISPDGKRAISGGDDKVVRVWDVEKGDLLASLKEHLEAVNAVAISADSRRALSGGDDKVVRLWNLETRKQIHRYKDHRDPVRAVALAPDGRHALSGGDDGRLRLWDLKEARPDRPVWRAEEVGQKIASVAITADGRRALAGTQSQGLIVWDAKTGRENNRYPAPFAFLGLAVPTDGQHALTAQNDGSLRLWDLPALEAPGTTEAFTIEGRYPVIHNANALELSAWASRMKRVGFLPTLVNGHDAGGIPHYAALAVKNTAGTAWEIRLDDGPSEIQKTFQDMMGREFWVISQCGYAQGASNGLISVWIPKKSLPVGGNYHGATRSGWDAFEVEYQAQTGKKTRLATLSVYPLGNQRLFAGLWSPDDGTPARPPRIGLGPEDLDAYLKEARRDGYHPISVSVYGESAENRYAIVVHRDLPGLRWDVSPDLGPEALQQELARQIAKGFHPLLLTGYPRLQASRYTAVWVDDHIQTPKRIGTEPASPKTEMSQR